MTLHLAQGDITLRDDDAIVNAANELLLPGGGVCGAIHKAAGPELAAECRSIGMCLTGEAHITSGYKLLAKYVIHAVGPMYRGGSAKEESMLAACYRNSLDLADKHGVKTIAFPAISTGIYGFPQERAASIAVRTVADALSAYTDISEVIF